MSAAHPVVLVIEDEAPIRRFLRTALIAEGFEVIEAENGARAVLDAANRKPECIILDLGLPDMDGVEVIRRVREWSGVPVIVLSARTQEHEKIAALDAGADDFVTKPFSVGELFARLRVALRHAATLNTGTPSTAFEAGDLRVDLAARKVQRDGVDVHLTPIEYRLLIERDAMARIEGFFQRVQRARADIAIYDAERGERDGGRALRMGGNAVHSTDSL